MPEEQSDPLDCLVVIDKLEIGPLRVEKQRFVAPYRVHQNGAVDETELIYRWEEDVFDPDDPAALNLACMIAAQVALNYGLFCREIVFHGIFDKYDRQFIEDVARHSAREIYVKKFQEENPFLTGPAASLPAVKRDSYLKARLSFVDASPEGKPFEAPEWQTDSDEVVVLSSGGKESLLSFALLKEIGKRVSPVYINESGRHWFTALNGYRHMAANVPGTARVWTNADRVFNWMLRHFPFVRPDYAKIRADMYPVRLWTVAVFVFGALPLARKRGAGCIVVGDEYDTTVRTQYKGITHYDGLYDQSRYFDNAMTRYYRGKRFSMAQFSVLRPVSEILVEKILAERYPELQRHQLSCHAAHTEGEQVKPCGQCEKCRRVVGMLKALGADPRNCGYTDDQIENCLARLLEKGVHQESAGSEHMVYLLQQKGLVDPGIGAELRPRPHPEVMKLRFDPEKSPFDTFPMHLREPLYRIYMQYAEGAAQRQGRVWVDVDPFDEASLRDPYAFEARAGRREAPPARGETAVKTASAPPETYLIGEMTWPEAQTRFKEIDVAILPVGSIEQHGPHLPLDTDAFDADFLARAVAAACKPPRPIVLPLIPYGVSYHHDDFSGTFSIGPDTLSQLVYEIGLAAARNGITKLVMINGHGGNGPALHYAAQKINRDARIFTCVDTGETSDDELGELTDTPNDVHAGEVETSTTLANRPHLVRLDQAKKHVPKFSSRYLDFSSRQAVGWYAHTSRISSSGVMGDPTRASREKGEKMWKIMIANLVEFIEDLKRFSLDEIFQKRY